MTVAAGFLWRFLDDVWDLLPTKDRSLFEAYWSAQLQIAGNLQQGVIEARLSTTIANIPVFQTERWNRFQMSDASCDLFAATDVITLTGTAAAALARETALYHTLKVSSSTGALLRAETILFEDSSIHRLRYGMIGSNAVAVTIGSVQYTEGRDYVVNRVEGTIQALEDGRLPIDVVATVRYFHDEYTRGLDYELDERASTIARLAGSDITSGSAVAVKYTYNNTATLALQGTTGVVDVDLVTLEDPNKDFSALPPGRTLVVASGPNTGTYVVEAVLSPTSLRITTTFPVAQNGEVVYNINAYPHGQRVDKRIVSIPVLQDHVDDPALMLIEGVHYIVGGGILASTTAFPLAAIGPTESREPTMWAEKTSIDNETPYRNFGVLIDFYRTNGEAYKLALQGLWYAFWTGSTPGNLQRGLHILLGLPFAKDPGTIVAVTAPSSTIAGEVKVQDAKGRIVSYAIPAGLGLADGMALGASVARFQSLSTGVTIIDRNNEPGFVATRLGRAGISRFLTDNATVGPGDTDETKALTLLENHLFLPQVLVEALTNRINVTELRTFLDNMKPSWTEYVFSFNADNADEPDSISFTEEFDAESAIDLTTTVGSNEGLDALAGQDFIIARNTGEIIGGGTQATGNFRDSLVDFAVFGLGAGDLVRISNGTYLGYHVVLARINPNVLALDIPDSPAPAGATSIDYVVLQKEFGLGHDAVQLKREHVILNGTVYGTPTALNTKTNADFLDLNAEEVKALLLIDATHAGHEVQPITAANIALGEITVGTAPTPATHAHQLASAALKRVDNSGPTVTDVFAI